MKKLKKHWKTKRTLVVMDGRINVKKMASLLETIYNINEIPIRIPMAL